MPVFIQDNEMSRQIWDSYPQQFISFQANYAKAVLNGYENQLGYKTQTVNRLVKHFKDPTVE